MTDHERVTKYYAQFDEWARLDTPEGRLEYERALHILDHYLKPQSRILDLGGGPGRYAIALAQRNHRVVLADISPELLDRVRKEVDAAGVGSHIESIDLVDAVCLGSYAPATFDAVIAFGPFYHLTEASEREAAAAEIGRVLKQKGLLFASFIPRMAGMGRLIDRAAIDAEQVTADVLLECLETGVFHNQATRGFQEGYYPYPHEIKSLFEKAGITCISLASLRGIGNMAASQLDRLHPTLRNEVLAIVEKTATDPAVVGCCGHAVLIGSKP